MKLYISYVYVLLLFIAACGNMPKTREVEPATPKALQDNNSSYEIISKRNHNNLVNQLYAEIVGRDTVLGLLEKAIDAIPETKEDSLRAFHSFDQKNSSYYESAKELVQHMPDSVLRKFADSVLKGSVKKYNNLIARHEELENHIKEQTQQLQSLHALCKLAYTLPVIEEFQQQLPSLSSLEGYKKQIDSVTKRTTLLTNKKLK